MRQQRSYSTEAIILKHSDLGEADRILTLLTPYKGKVRAIAKGTRRAISKKAGHLELLYHSQLQVAHGRNLDIVTQAQGIDSFLSLRNELWHMTCGFYLAELVERFIEDETQHLNVYNLLLMALHMLDKDASEVSQLPATDRQTSAYSRTQLLMRYFEIHLLTAIGYEPALRNCAHCSAGLQPVENGFTPALGGALCPDCRGLWGQSLSMHALKVLRLLHRTEWSQVPRLQLPVALHAEIEAAMHGLLRYHLERDLKSWSFLEMLVAKSAGQA